MQLVTRADIISYGMIHAQICKRTLERIRILNPETNAFRETFDEEAMNEARKIDERLARGEDPGPLTGVPIGIKDNIATTEGTTSCGSRMLEGYRSPYEATVVGVYEAPAGWRSLRMAEEMHALSCKSEKALASEVR